MRHILQAGIDEGLILPIVPVEEFTHTLFLLGDMAYKAYPNDPKAQKIFVDFYSFVLVRGIMSDSAIVRYSEIIKQGSGDEQTTKLYNSILKDLVPTGVNLKNYLINLIADSKKTISNASRKPAKVSHRVKAAPVKKSTRRKKKKRLTVKEKYEAKVKEKEEKKGKQPSVSTPHANKPARRGRPCKSTLPEE